MNKFRAIYLILSTFFTTQIHAAELSEDGDILTLKKGFDKVVFNQVLVSDGKTIEEVTLVERDDRVSSADLAAIFKHCPNLKRIQMHSKEINFSVLAARGGFKPIPSTQMEFIDLSGTRLDVPTFVRLLRSIDPNSYPTWNVTLEEIQASTTLLVALVQAHLPQIELTLNHCKDLNKDKWLADINHPNVLVRLNGVENPKCAYELISPQASGHVIRTKTYRTPAEDRDPIVNFHQLHHLRIEKKSP